MQVRKRDFQCAGGSKGPSKGRGEVEYEVMRAGYVSRRERVMPSARVWTSTW